MSTPTDTRAGTGTATRTGSRDTGAPPDPLAATGGRGAGAPTRTPTHPRDHQDSEKRTPHS